MKLKYCIEEIDKNKYENIHSLLKNELHISNRLLTKLIEQNCICLNNSICDTRNSFEVHDMLTIDFEYFEDNTNVVSTKMDLDIIYEDEWLLIINKPAGIAIHPSILHYADSLSNGVKFYFDSIGLQKKIRPVNRLDFNTSGLVIFAKCAYIQEALSKQMNENLFKKEYLCIVEGVLDKKTGSIDLSIARKPGSIIERCIDSAGQPSRTIYEVIKEFQSNSQNDMQPLSLVKCKLETGRTHQIRVHFSHIGHPLLGDTLYGNSSPLITRQALHSYMISFVHPITKKEQCFTCPLPDDMKDLLT